MKSTPEQRHSSHHDLPPFDGYVIGHLMKIWLLFLASRVAKLITTNVEPCDGSSDGSSGGDRVKGDCDGVVMLLWRRQ